MLWYPSIKELGTQSSMNLSLVLSHIALVWNFFFHRFGIHIYLCWAASFLCCDVSPSPIGLFGKHCSSECNLGSIIIGFGFLLSGLHILSKSISFRESDEGKPICLCSSKEKKQYHSGKTFVVRLGYDFTVKFLTWLNVYMQHGRAFFNVSVKSILP